MTHATPAILTLREDDDDGKPVPVIVRVVPPPVPPLVGLTDVTVGVSEALYVNEEDNVLTIELTVTETVHVESTRGVEDAGVVHVNDETLLCVIEHVAPQIVTKVDEAYDELASKPIPFIVKLRPPALPPCDAESVASVRS